MNRWLREADAPELKRVVAAGLGRVGPARLEEVAPARVGRADVSLQRVLPASAVSTQEAAGAALVRPSKTGGLFGAREKKTIGP